MPGAAASASSPSVRYAGRADAPWPPFGAGWAHVAGDDMEARRRARAFVGRLPEYHYADDVSPGRVFRFFSFGTPVGPKIGALVRTVGAVPSPEVAAVLTPASAADVAGAIVAAYTRLRGRAPASRESWLYPLALSANETASWSQLYNHNIGNVTGTGADGPWYRNPHVTSALKFRDFPTLESGAETMLRDLEAHGGLDAADRADLGGFQVALNAYLGGAYPSIGALVARLRSTSPGAGVAASSSATPTRARAAAAVDVVAAIAGAALGVAAAIALSRWRGGFGIVEAAV